MEKHMEKLKGICRLCKLSIFKGDSYVTKKTKEQYAIEILEIFNYNIEDDIPSTHPLHICNNCRKRLDGYKVSRLTKKVQITAIAEFEEHDDNCKLCKKHSRLNQYKYAITYKTEIKKDLQECTELKPLTTGEIISQAEKKQFVVALNETEFLVLSKISKTDRDKPYISYSLKILLDDFSWSLVVNEKEIIMKSYLPYQHI